MNITMHPSHWFQHEHKAQEPIVHARVWQIMHSETFWIFTVLFAVFPVTIFLALTLGKNLPVNSQYAPRFPC